MAALGHNPDLVEDFWPEGFYPAELLPQPTGDVPATKWRVLLVDEDGAEQEVVVNVDATLDQGDEEFYPALVRAVKVAGYDSD